MSEQNQNMIFVTGRLCFPWLVEPQRKKNDQGVETATYNCDLLMAPSDPGFAKFMQTYAALAQEKWKENAQAAMQRIASDRKTRCYFAGEEKVNSKTFQILDGYAGNVGITARSTRQPQIIRPDGTAVDPTNTMEIRAVASKMYGGCYVNVVIKPWLQQNDKGIGVRCDLIAIQFAKDGDAFGAGNVDATGFFQPVATAGAAPVAFAAPQMPPAPFPGAAPAPFLGATPAPAPAPFPGAAPAAPAGMPAFLIPQ